MTALQCSKATALWSRSDKAHVELRLLYRSVYSSRSAVRYLWTLRQGTWTSRPAAVHCPLRAALTGWRDVIPRLSDTVIPAWSHAAENRSSACQNLVQRMHHQIVRQNKLLILQLRILLFAINLHSTIQYHYKNASGDDELIACLTLKWHEQRQSNTSAPVISLRIMPASLASCLFSRSTCFLHTI